MKDVTNVRLVRSKHLVFQTVGSETTVYHSLHGRPTLLNRTALQFLHLFRKPTTLISLLRRYDIEDASGWTRRFVRDKFLCHPEVDERAKFQRSVKRAIGDILKRRKIVSLGLIMDEGCNFACGHCIARKVNQVSVRAQSQRHRMDWEVAQRAIDTFVEVARHTDGEPQEVYFGGSEPFLNWSLIQRVVKYCVERYRNVCNFKFSTNTNATLITPERASFLVAHHFTITSSLDGLRFANDRSRVTASGRGSFDRILAGWDALGQQGQPITWFCLTLTDRNINEIEESFFDFISARGIETCTFEPDLIERLSLPPSEVVTKLIRFKKWGAERGISIGGLWDKPLKNLFEPKLKQRLFNCSAFTGRGISVLPDGQILTCAYSAKTIGTIEDLPMLFTQPRFRDLVLANAVGHLPECSGCAIEGQCIGGCAITREYGEYTRSHAAFRYRCEIYRQATKELLQQTMVA